MTMDHPPAAVPDIGAASIPRRSDPRAYTFRPNPNACGLVPKTGRIGRLAEFTAHEILTKFPLQEQQTVGGQMLVLRVGTTPFCKGSSDLSVLRQNGVRAEAADTGRDALDFLRLYDYDLVLMDLHLADVPGYEVVRTIRAAGFKVPVVMLSDTATAQAKVRALDQGADDFVIVPCDADELLARIRAVVRRSQGHCNSVLRLGPVELSLHRREVRVHGEPLHLSRREFGVLELLFLKQGTILNKTAFLNHLYCGIEEPEMKTIDVIICRLRKKLAAAGVPTLIDTVWGCGYILREPELAPAKQTGSIAWLSQATHAAAAA